METIMVNRGQVSIHGSTVAGKVIYFAALFLLATCTSQGSGQKDIDFATIVEMIPDDIITVPPETVVRQCSVVLDKKKAQTERSVVRALTYRGTAYLDLQKFELARQDFAELCRLRPTSSEAHRLHATSIMGL